MSLFKDMAESARDAHEHYFARQILLTEPGSEQITVTAVLYKSRTETRTDEHGRQNRVTVRDCRFTSLESVRHDATIVADDATWTIDEVISREASGLYVRLQKITQHQTGRVAYRGKG